MILGIPELTAGDNDNCKSHDEARINEISKEPDVSIENNFKNKGSVAPEAAF